MSHNLLFTQAASSKSHCHDQRNFTHNIGLDQGLKLIDAAFCNTALLVFS